MVKILISDKLSAQAVAVFADRGLQADVKTGLSPEQLGEMIGEYDALAIRSSTTVTPEILAKATKLKVIGRAGIGVDNVDLKAATAQGVVVMNTPFGNSITTAEHAIAMMFALARQIPQADISTQSGKWEKSRFMGVEVTGKTLGIIGCGNIGAIVANKALGLGMKVVAFDPFLTEDTATKIGVDKVSFDDLLRRADFITLHTPLNDKTRNIIDKTSIAKMKKGARLINCARGGLAVEADVRAALDSGQLAGAAFDVFAVEPAKENILFGHPNFIATPHLGASTTEAQENVAVQVAEQIADFLLTGAVVNAVNVPSVTAEQARTLKPYLELSEMLGGMAGQLTESGIKRITITYSGKTAALNTKPLTSTVLAALLSPLLDSVNAVNAAVVAKERGIEIRETLDDSDKRYPNAITLAIETEKRSRSVTGTVFAGTTPRVVEIEGIPIEATLGTHVLFVRNKDKPGFIGRLGTALGEANINIATFNLGRTAAGEDAIALVEVDQPIPESLVAVVAALPNVVQARQLSF